MIRKGTIIMKAMSFKEKWYKIVKIEKRDIKIHVEQIIHKTLVNSKRFNSVQSSDSKLCFISCLIFVYMVALVRELQFLFYFSWSE